MPGEDWSTIMTTDTEALRAQFERQCRGLDLSRNEDGVYTDEFAYVAWIHYQEGYAAAKAETDAAVAKEREHCALVCEDVRRAVTYVCPVCYASMVDDQEPEIARLRAAVAQLRDALLKVKWRPAQESAFIASVNLQDVERRYGVDVDWNSRP